ncbi:MAG: hypothetical protein A2X47_08195 [Lentisphaerae bacterium GWF2_38_69]|nr:MAG: hypothetical protein A2X47_08195 [Lentisphaerae bacterium GWF2_38_69]
MDICGYPFAPLEPKTSNLGKISVSIGGVGRNIAENIARIGVNTKLITAIGSDGYGRMIEGHCIKAKIDTGEIVQIQGENSSSYMAVLDSNNDMNVAIADTHILDNITIDVAESKIPTIRKSAICVMDAGCTKEVIKFITDSCPETIFFLDTVCTVKARKVTSFLGNFHTIKPNIFEAEVLSGISIKSKSDIIKAAEIILRKGVRRVFISLAAEGVFYNDSEHNGFMSVKSVNIVNATGAGDAFVAALACCHLAGFDIITTVKHALAASHIALSSKEAVNPKMSMKLLTETVKELQYVQ